MPRPPHRSACLPPGHAYLVHEGGSSYYVTLKHTYNPGTLRDSSGAVDHAPRGRKCVVLSFKVTDWRGAIDEDVFNTVTVTGTEPPHL